MIIHTFLNADNNICWELDADAIDYLTQAFELLRDAAPGTLLATPMKETNHVLLRGVDA